MNLLTNIDIRISEYDFILIGAGFFCSVIAERIANELDKRVLIIEKRDHIGGNCYSEVDRETNIEFHKYGTHIFHTSNEKVWSYINQFTSFNNYYHQVLTTHKNRVYQMPINLETINDFYNLNLKPYEVNALFEKERSKEFYKNPKNFEEQAINNVGRRLYEAFLKGYTIKQWGRSPKQIPNSVVKRLPFRTNYNESYFFDKWQGIPLDGYTNLFNKLLSSNNIDVILNIDFFDIKNKVEDAAIPIIYSGPIDRLFDYKYGDLEYRTLRFEYEIRNVVDYQGTSVMNYADLSIPCTRIHEPKHLHIEREREYSLSKTLIIKEFSSECKRKDPYYPVGKSKNKYIYNKYLQELRLKPSYIIGGRLGDYKYYDMHHTILRALETYENKIWNERISYYYSSL